ncbi:MAG: hypothetical protein K2X38_16100 [Gemmataceae bacterium]|nr:hypothetical protein [Gemmataceae bacterium]
MRSGFVSLALALALVGPAFGQTVDLTEAGLKDACFRVQMSMSLDGKVTVQQEGTNKSFPHQARASHEYLERVLDAKDNRGERAARVYSQASVEFPSHKTPTKNELRTERRLQAVYRDKKQLVSFSPRGPMTREEMEVTEHLDTLTLPGLLPGRTTKVGETWKLPTSVVESLCVFDGIEGNELIAKLEKVEGERAVITIQGTAKGIGMGASANLLVNAQATFDVQAKRIVGLEWKQSDQRTQGPVSPALSADIVIRVVREAIEQPKQLSDLALVIVPSGSPPSELTELVYRDTKKGMYELRHAREWHVVSQQDGRLVLRLLSSRGDFVAQCTLTPWRKVGATGALKLEEFADLMAKSPGWQQETELEKEQPKSAQGYSIHRVTASGKLVNVAAVQSFYLVVGKEGEQLIGAFTMTPVMARELASRDVTLIDSLRFLKEENAGTGTALPPSGN